MCPVLIFLFKLLKNIPWKTPLYSAPDLVMETTEELNARPSLAEKVSCQRESFIIFHYLRSGRSVFGQRWNLGTTGAEQPSPCLRSPKVGELLALSLVWALDFPAQLISYLSIWTKSYFCRRLHYKLPSQQPLQLCIAAPIPYSLSYLLEHSISYFPFGTFTIFQVRNGICF